MPAMTGSEKGAPITIALVDDYDVVLTGVAHMLSPYRDRVAVAEIDANTGVEEPVDIALYDSFAQPESDHDEITALIANPRRGAWSSTPGTSIPIWWRAPPEKVCTAISRRRCLPATRRRTRVCPRRRGRRQSCARSQRVGAGNGLARSRRGAH